MDVKELYYQLVRTFWSDHMGRGLLQGDEFARPALETALRGVNQPPSKE